MPADDEEGEGGDEIDGNNILSNFQTIPIRLSDISKLDFRFIHPVNLVTDNNNGGGSSSVVQVSSCSDNNMMMTERMTWSNNNDNFLEIHLPSIMTCDDEGDQQEIQ